MLRYVHVFLISIYLNSSVIHLLPFLPTQVSVLYIWCFTRQRRQRHQASAGLDVYTILVSSNQIVQFNSYFKLFRSSWHCVLYPFVCAHLTILFVTISMLQIKNSVQTENACTISVSGVHFKIQTTCSLRDIYLYYVCHCDVIHNLSFITFFILVVNFHAVESCWLLLTEQ